MQGPWGFHGDSKWGPWRSHRELMAGGPGGSHEKSMGTPWGPMGSPWTHGCPSGSHWELMCAGELMGSPWGPWAAHGGPWGAHEEPIGVSWETMGIPWGAHGPPRGAMHLSAHGCPRGSPSARGRMPSGAHGDPMNAHVDSWGAMGDHGDAIGNAVGNDGESWESHGDREAMLIPWGAYRKGSGGHGSPWVSHGSPRGRPWRAIGNP